DSATRGIGYCAYSIIIKDRLPAAARGRSQAALPRHQFGQEAARMGAQSAAAGRIAENYRVFRQAAAIRPKRRALTDSLGQTRSLIAPNNCLRALVTAPANGQRRRPTGILRGRPARSLHHGWVRFALSHEEAKTLG